MEGAAKKARRIPEVLVVPPAQLLKSKQQIPPQAFPFQQSKRAPSLLTPASPQMQQFYQQQQLQSQQTHQQFHHPLPLHIRRQPHIQPKKSLDELQVVELDPSSASPVAPPWMLPATINMPLHAVSPGFSLLSSSPPPPAAGAPVPSPSNVAPVRRVGAKRVAGPDDWRLANSCPTPGFIATPPLSGPGYVVAPANFPGPINVPSFSNRVAQQQTPARAAATEKRKLKLKQVTAAYQSEYQEACQRLLALQREWREECEAKLAQENYILV